MSKRKDCLLFRAERSFVMYFLANKRSQKINTNPKSLLAGQGRVCWQRQEQLKSFSGYLYLNCWQLVPPQLQEGEPGLQMKALQNRAAETEWQQFIITDNNPIKQEGARGRRPHDESHSLRAVYYRRVEKLHLYSAVFVPAIIRVHNT